MANSFSTDRFNEIPDNKIQNTESAEFLTETPSLNPIAKQYLNLPLSEQEIQYIDDYRYLPKDSFDLKYGLGASEQANYQEEIGSSYAKDKSIGSSASIFNGGDLLKNVLKGAVTGTLGTAAYLSEKAGSRGGSEDLVKLSEKLGKYISDSASYEQKAAARAFSYETEGKAVESARIFQEDLEKIKNLPEEERQLAYDKAVFDRETRDFYDTLEAGWETGYSSEAMGTGIGSIGASVIGAKGIGGAISGTAKLAKASASTLFKAKNAYHLANPKVQRILNNTSWMVSAGLQEAGGVLTENLSDEKVQEILNIPHEVLLENSDLYRHNYLEYRKQGMKPGDAEFQARKDLAFKIAERAADAQAIATTPLNWFTRGLAKPFTKGGKPLTSFIGEGFTEPLEEGLAEGLGQFAANYSKSHYTELDQDPYEGIGSSAAEGVVGGLGITATRVPGTVLSTTFDGIKGGVKLAGKLSGKNLDPEHKERFFKRLDNLSTSVEAIQNDLGDLVKDPNNIANVTYSLRPIAEEILATRSNEAGKQESTLSGERAMELLSQIENAEEVITNASTEEMQKSNQSLANKVENLKDADLSAIQQLKSHIHKVMESKADSLYGNMDESKRKSAKLTDEQVVAEARVIASAKAAGESYSYRYSPEQLNQINSYDKFDPVLEEKVNLANNVQNSSLNANNIGELKGLPTLTSVDTSNSSEPTKTFLHSKDGRVLINIREPDAATPSTISIGDREFVIPEEALSKYREIVSNNASANEQQQALENISDYFSLVDAFDDTNKTLEFSYTDDSGKTHDIFTSKVPRVRNFIKIDDSIYILSSNIANTLNDPNASKEDKLNATKQLFLRGNKINLVSHRQAQSLDTEPEHRITQTISYDEESGTVTSKDYDADINREKFKEQFSREEDHVEKVTDKNGKEKEVTKTKKFGLSEAAHLVRRPFHLLLQDNPIQALRNLLSSYDNIASWIRANHFTNAATLLSKLFTNKNNIIEKTVNKAIKIFDKKSKLIDQIMGLLNPDGVFMKGFLGAANKFDDIGNHSPEVREVFQKYVWDENGKTDRRIVEAVAVAAVQFLSKLHNYKHEMDAAELARYLIALEKQNDDFHTADGIIEPMAMLNFATTIRKILGISQNNKISEKEFELILGGLAVKAMAILKEQGIVEVSSITVKMTKNGKLEDVEMPLYTVSENYKSVFNGKGDILEALLDPTYKNAWETSVPESVTTMAHTTEPNTKAVQKGIDHANSMGATLNLSVLRVISSLGGFDGFFKLLFGEITNESSHYYNQKDLARLKGQALTRSLAKDVIREILLGNTENALEKLEIFFSNIAVRNGRMMQQGSATAQANKVLRTLLQFTQNQTIDLSNAANPDRNMLRWIAAMAQNIGQKVGNKPLQELVEPTMDFVNKVGTIINKAKYASLLESFKSSDVRKLSFDHDLTEQEANNQQLFQELLAEVEQETGVTLQDKVGAQDLSGINALIEAIEFNQATPEEKKNFISHLQLEIDGRNDGPAYVNAIYGVAIAGFTPITIRNFHKTGFYIGVDTTGNEALSNTEAGELLGTAGTDFHGEVTLEKLPYYLLQRIAELNKDPDSNETPLNVIKNMLTLFKAVGLIKGNIALALRWTEDNFGKIDMPITFSRDVSKEATTVDVYGSGVRGTTGAILREWVWPKLYREISARIQQVTKDSLPVTAQLVKDFADAFDNEVVYVIDTETTNTDPEVDAVLQVSIRKVKNGQTIEELEPFLIENTSGREIPKTLNGNVNPLLDVYNNSNNKKLTKAEAAEKIKNFVGNGTLVGHNLKEFDAPILTNYLGLDLSNNKKIDTLELMPMLDPAGHNGSYKLEDLKVKYGFSVKEGSSSHLADADTDVTAQLMSELRKNADSYIEKNKNNPVQTPFEPQSDLNGVAFSTLMNALKELTGVSYDALQGTYESVSESDQSKLMSNWSNKVYSSSEMKKNAPRPYKGKLYQSKEAKKANNDLRFFEITNEGESHITELLMPFLGEPAQAAVYETVGHDGMRGSNMATIVAAIINYLAQGTEQLFSRDGHTLSTVSKSEAFARQRLIDKLSPIITLPGGQKINPSKLVYSVQDEPLIEDPESGVKFYASENRKGSIGVSGSAITTHAMGDATVIIKFLEYLREQGFDEETASIVAGLVFDGVYTSPEILDIVSELLNKASYYAINQLIMKSLHKALEKAGNNLIQESTFNIKVKNSNPFEAIKVALTRLATNRLIDGTLKTEKDYSLDRDENTPLHKDLLDLLHKMDGTPVYEPSLEKARTNKKKDYTAKFNDDSLIQAAVEGALDSFFINVEAVVLNEEIAHEVLRHIPMVCHHMGGWDKPYIQGVPLSLAEAKELTEHKELQKYITDKKQAYNEIMAAYLSALWTDQFNKINKTKRKELSGKELEHWNNVVHALKELTHRQKGNSGHMEMSPAEAKIVSEKFENAYNKAAEQAKKAGKPAPEKVYTFIASKNKGTKQVTVETVRDIFLNQRKKVSSFSPRVERILSNLYGKIASAIIPNLEVYIVASRDDLPENVRSQFTNNEQRGIYINRKNEAPTIYIIDTESSLDINTTKNREILIHEVIHSLFSKQWATYFSENKNSLDPKIITAFDNLVSLVDELLTNDALVFEREAPTQIRKLQQILRSSKTKAEKYDEATAYILSEARVLNALCAAKLADPAKQLIAQRNFFTLLKDVVTAAKNAWKALLGIITGSSLDKILEDRFKDGEKTSYTEDDIRDAISTVDTNEPFDFLSLYGANTLVALNFTLDPYIDTEGPNKGKVTYSKNDLKRIVKEDLGFVRNHRELVDEGINLGYPSYQARLKENLKNKLQVIAAFRARSKIFANQLKSKFSTSQALKEELIKIRNYQAALTNKLNSLGIKNAASISEQVIGYLSNDLLTPTENKEITKLYLNFIEQFDKAKFNDPDLKEAIGKLLDPALESVIVNKDGIPSALFFKEKFEQQAIFFALWNELPELQEAVKGIPMLQKHKKPSWSWDLERNLEKFVLYLNEKWEKETFEGKLPKEVMKELDKFQKRREVPDSPFLKSLAFLDTLKSKVSTEIMDALIFPTLSLLGADNLVKNKDTLLSVRLDAREKGLEHVRQFANRHLPIWATNLVKGIYGRLPSNNAFHSLLKKLKGDMDRIRKSMLDQIPEQLTKLFTHNKIDDKARKFFSKTIGRMDIAALSLEMAKECLTDKANILSYISKRENELRAVIADLKKDSKIADLQIQKAKELADYLAGSRKASHNLLTNENSVADLVGTDYFQQASAAEIRLLDELITLYSMEFLTDSDIKQYQNYYKNDQEGIEAILNQIKDYKQKEKQKPDAEKYKYLYFKNFIPSGTAPKGHYIIVPKRLEKDFYAQGYNRVKDKNSGIYQASNIDKSEPYVRMFNPYPHHREFQEGLLQVASSTYFGYYIGHGSRVEAQGTRITDAKVAVKIVDQYENETSGNALIPLYSADGAFKGFERSIPPEDRDMIEDHDDLFSGISQSKVRQEREKSAQTLTIEAVKVAWEDYSSASEEAKKKEFIDVFHTDNPAIKKAVARFDNRTLDAISALFGGDKNNRHLYLRKDEIDTVIGFYRASITDAWDNSFILPKPLEDAITGVIDAFVTNGRGRYYAGVIESNIIGITSYVRNTIVIRSGIVPLVNAVSNILLLNIALGVPLTKVVSLTKESIIDTEEYNKLFHKNIKLDFLIENLNQKINDLSNSSNPANSNEIKRLKNILKDFESEKIRNTKAIQALPIYPLVKSGEYSTISPEGMLSEDFDIYRQKAEEWVTNIINKTFSDGDKAKKWASNLVMTRGSDTYGVMAKFVNYGDWVAKVVAYRYLTEGKYTKDLTFKFTEEDAKMIASNLFVDYDQFNGREMDYLNRVGLTWFMTYKMRILAALSLGMAINPTRMITGTLLAGGLGGLGTPVSDNAVSSLFAGDLGYSIGMFDMWMRGIMLHPLASIIRLF